LTASGELFCGDLFENTKGPVLNSPIDDPAVAQASLAKLDARAITTVYPGHGPPFAMELLRKSMSSDWPLHQTAGGVSRSS
jgi:hydroxyacylglutathione hydrolase